MSMRASHRSRRCRQLEEVGPVPERAPVGHGPRGLQSTTATPGSTFRTITPAAAPIAGARTASPGFSDAEQRLCLASRFGTTRDPILKERLFGLTNSEGNHGEDVKELYYYLDATPTHSYLQMLYKYPQRRVSLRASGRGEPPPRDRSDRSSS